MSRNEKQYPKGGLNIEKTKSIPKLKGTMLTFSTVCSMAASVGVFALMWEWYYRYLIVLPFYRKGNWLIIAIYGLLLYIFTKLYGGYRIGFHRVSEIIYSQIVALVFVTGITYLQISLINRDWVNPLPLAMATFVQICLIFLWSLASNKIYFALFPPRRMVLVHTGGHSVDILEKMSSRHEKFNIVHTILYNNNAKACCRVFKGFEAVVLSGIPADARETMVSYCYKYNLRVYIVPTISDVLLSNSDQLNLFDTPLMLLRNRGLSEESRFAKRTLDLIVAGLALVLLSPVMLLTALAIKLSDGGPVLYRQERLTRDGKLFYVLKFRSMVVDAESDGVARLASQSDDRITPVGAFIRKLRLDELPQVLNVLKGEMSIVGPRPERPEIASEYEKTMPEFQYRLRVKAGLTGYAQVLGKYNTTPQDKLLLDLMYIESFSLVLDIKIILMTVKVLFWPESTEGVRRGAALPIDVDEEDVEAVSK